MKKCAYCTTENRDQAIFCRRCKHPLQAASRRKDHSARDTLIWILAVFVLIGFVSYLFSARSSLAPAAIQTPSSNGTAVTGPAPTRTQEPVTVDTCVRDTTRIRRGPSTQHETIGGLLFGTCLTILGRNEDASWVYIVSKDHQTGWVATSLLTGAGDISRVSVRDDSAMASSSRPTLTSAEIAHGAQTYLTQVSATNNPEAPFTRYMVPCFETADRVGDQVSCRMEKAYCDHLPAAEGSPTVCRDRPRPDHTFALIVFGEDWSHYDGQCIIVSGYLEIAGGVLQKCTNYNFRVAIVGDISQYTEKSGPLRDFVYESNKRGDVRFVSDLGEL